MSHNTLMNYYQTIFALVHDYRFGTIDDIESLIPFESEVYTGFIRQRALQKQEDERQEAAIREAIAKHGGKLNWQVETQG